NVEGIPHDVMIGIEKMWAYMRYQEETHWGPGRPKWVISKACVNLIRELKKLRWATYSSDRQAYDVNKKDEVHKKDDHAFDSTRYFFTTRPDLTPAIDSERTSDGRPVTLTYAELINRMRLDPTVTFAEDKAEWETTALVEDDYEQEDYLVDY